LQLRYSVHVFVHSQGVVDVPENQIWGTRIKPEGSAKTTGNWGNQKSNGCCKMLLLLHGRAEAARKLKTAGQPQN
jgi:hypothetical protein